jgi:hypothetical protein
LKLRMGLVRVLVTREHPGSMKNNITINRLHRILRNFRQ